MIKFMSAMRRWLKKTPHPASRGLNELRESTQQKKDIALRIIRGDDFERRKESLPVTLERRIRTLHSLGEHHV